MIEIKVEPIDPMYIDDLGTAKITLDVNSNTETGKPIIQSEHKFLPKAIELKVLISPHDKVGHIIDPDQHTGPTLMHCLQVWNSDLSAYKLTVMEGESFVQPPPEKPLPKGAIP